MFLTDNSKSGNVCEMHTLSNAIRYTGWHPKFVLFEIRIIASELQRRLFEALARSPNEKNYLQCKQNGQYQCIQYVTPKLERTVHQYGNIIRERYCYRSFSLLYSKHHILTKLAIECKMNFNASIIILRCSKLRVCKSFA